MRMAWVLPGRRGRLWARVRRGGGLLYLDRDGLLDGRARLPEGDRLAGVPGLRAAEIAGHVGEETQNP